MEKIAFLRPHRQRTCQGCGYNLSRSPAGHTLCKTCFSYSRFRAVLADHMRVIREVRT
jgi:hypothetical protein